VFGGPNPGARAMPTALSNLLDKATRRTLHRGGQSGGVASVVARENGHIEIGFRVEKTAKEKSRRSPLAELMARSRDRLGAAAERDGFGGLNKIVAIAHTRYGTNLAPPVAKNAHPHESEARTESIFFVGDRNRHDAYERAWEKPQGPAEIKNVSAPRGVVIAHNGDDNATAALRWADGGVMDISNNDDAEISVGFPNTGSHQGTNDYKVEKFTIESDWMDASHTKWFNSMFDKFLGCIERKEFVNDEIRESYACVEVIEKCYRSSEQGSKELALECGFQK
jgi:hypothetical protein